MTTSTHITTSGGLISAAFIENIREPGSRQRGVEPASYALPWSEAPVGKGPSALEETIATAWELLLERWDAVRNDLPMMDVSQVRARWLLPLFQLLDFDPVYLRGDTILDEAGKLRYSLSHRGWAGADLVSAQDGPILHTDPDSHRRCRRGARSDDVIRGIRLFVDSRNDVVTIEWPLPEQTAEEDASAFYTTLLEALEQELAVTLDLDESEVGGFLVPIPEMPNQQRLVLYETAEGGTGAVGSLTDPARLGEIVFRTRELLHEGDPAGGCERACYECLRTFRSQFVHELLDRTLVLPAPQALEALGVEPVQEPPAGPSFEELEAQCQSDLEREVLAAIRDRRLPLPDAAQKTIYDGDEPIATADFFYTPRILVFVDGSPHYRDYIAAADQHKRIRLKALGYRVIVIRAEEPETGLDSLAGRLGQ